jgi:hypothetical protein
MAAFAEGKAESPTPEQMAGIKAFYRDCLGQDCDAPVRLAKNIAGETLPGETLCAWVYRGGSCTPAEVVYEPVHGTVYLYRIFDWPEKEGWQGKTHKDAIPSDRAWERALPILKRYGLSTSREDYEVVMEDLCTMELQDDLYGANWAVSGLLRHEGVLCRGASVQVHVSALTGDLNSFRYSPVVVPKVKHRVRVSKEEAIKRVEAWLKASGARFSGDNKVGRKSPGEIIEVIARPHDPGFHPEGSTGLEDKGEAYYCWQVPYKCSVDHGEDWFRALWVRVDTGEVIGGY